MTTLYCSRLIPSSCIHNLARWTERGAATEVLLSTSPPSWASSAPSNPKVGCLLLSVCTGPLFIVAGYQYNVSKSAVVTLTRCIGNEVVSSVTSTGNHLGAVVTVLSNHSILLYSDPAMIGFSSCLQVALLLLPDKMCAMANTCYNRAQYYCSSTSRGRGLRLCACARAWPRPPSCAAAAPRRSPR